MRCARWSRTTAPHQRSSEIRDTRTLCSIHHPQEAVPPTSSMIFTALSGTQGVCRVLIMRGQDAAAWSAAWTAAAGTRRCATLGGWLKAASTHRLAAFGTATTTPRPKASSARTRRRPSAFPVGGKPSEKSNGKPQAGPSAQHVAAASSVGNRPPDEAENAFREQQPSLPRP